MILALLGQFLKDKLFYLFFCVLLSFVWLLRKYREIRLLIFYVACFYIISELFVSVLFIYNIFL